MKNIIIIILSGITFFFAISFFCLTSNDWGAQIEGLGNFSYAAAREKAAAKPSSANIKIAVMGDWNSAAFRSLQRGAKLAAAENNAHNGVDGRKIELLFRDNQGTLSVSKFIVQELATSPEVTAVIAGMNYLEFSALAPLCEFNGLILMSPAFNPDSPTEQNAMKMIFSNYPDPQDFVDVMYKFLVCNQLKNSAIVSPSEHYYGYNFANTFDRQISRDPQGLTGVVRRELCYENEPYLLEKIFRSWDPKVSFDNMLICGNKDIVKNVVPLAGKLNPHAIFLLSDEIDNKIIKDVNTNGLKIFFPSVYDQDSPKSSNKNFCASFYQTYKVLPDSWAAQGYDTVNVLVAAMKAAKSIVPNKIANALYDIKFYNNVSTAPYIAFDRNGLLQNAIPVIKYIDQGEPKVLSDFKLKRP